MKDFSQDVVEKIDNYLSGKMSVTEKTQFETEIASDLDLKQEVEFQSDIINQIQKREFLRIKNNLNQIPVNTTSPFLQKQWLAVYSAVVISGAGVFTYMQYNSNDNNPYQSAQAVVLSTDYEDYYQNPEANTEIVVTDAEVVQERRKLEKTAKANKTVNPTQVNIDDSDESFDKQDVTVTNSVVAVKSSKNTTVEVELNKTKSKKLYYKFYDDKLYLYGNFDDTYVIHEMQTNFGIEYYIKVNQAYFKLDPHQVEKVEMQPVQNQKIINELNSK